MALLPASIAVGGNIKYQSPVYGSFVWHKNRKYHPSKYDDLIPQDNIFDNHHLRNIMRLGLKKLFLNALKNAYASFFSCQVRERDFYKQ